MENQNDNVPNVSGKMKIEKVKPDKQELKARKKAKKAKSNARTARFRTGKNLMIWGNGLVMGIIIFILCFLLLPLGVFFSLIPSDTAIVSENVSKKGLIQLLTSTDELTLNDFPILVDAMDDGNGGGLFGGTGMFTSYKEVEESVVNPETPKLYYYKNLKGEYKRAFKDNREYVDGVNGSTQLYYANLSKVSISEMPELLIASIERVDVSNLLDTFDINVDGVIGDIIDGKTVGDLMNLNTSDIKLSTFIEDNADNELLVNIVTAACKGESNKPYSEITVADFDNFNPDGIVLADVMTNVEENLKTMLAGATGVSFENITIANLKTLKPDDIRLNDVLSTLDGDIKNMILQAVNKGKQDNNEDALSGFDKITVGDFDYFDFDGIRLGTVLSGLDEGMKDMLENAIDGDEGFEEITLSALKSFNSDNILLKDVLSGLDDNVKNMILEGANQGRMENDPGSEPLASFDVITVKDLALMKTDSVSLSNVLELPTAENGYKNKKIYDILENAVNGGRSEGDAGYKEAKDILVSDLTSFSPDNIYLSNVLELPTAENEYKNKKIYDILVDAVNGGKSEGEEGYKTAQDILIADLSGSFDADNIRLSTVINYETNAKLFDILADATGKDAYKNTEEYKNADEDGKKAIEKAAKTSILIADLSGSFNVDNIKLATVIDYGANGKLFDILADATEKNKTESDKKSISMGDLSSSNFDVDKIRLATVIDYDTNGKLFDILSEATGKDAYKNTEEYKNADEDGKKAIEKTAKTGITMADLSGSGFDVTKIKLKTVIKTDDAGANAFLKQLVSDDTVTVGNIGTKINDLKISEAYPQECFKVDNSVDASKPADYGKYVKIKGAEKDTFILKVHYDAYKTTTYADVEIETDLYVLSEEANIWIFMLYDTPNVDVGGASQHHDEHGHAYEYIAGNLTVGEMEKDIDAVAKKLEDATVRQLVDAHILTDPKFDDHETYALSLSEVLGHIKDMEGLLHPAS